MKTSNFTRLFSTAAILGALATPAIAQEEEGMMMPGVSAELTLDYVTNYFFRGYEQTNGDDGIVLQPGASFTIPVIDEYTATIGTWNSYHTNGDALTGGNNWYESDLYASIDGPIAGDFSGSLGLTVYTYPALVASAVTELSATVSYDDSELLGDFAFNPYLMYAAELNNTNAVGGGGEADYLELGGEFSLEGLTEGTSLEAWTWTVPVTAGFSLHDYYQDASGSEEFFGYVSAGLVGSIPMEELIGTSEYFGAWDLTVGVTALLVNGDIDTNLNTNGGGTLEFIGTVGISREY